MGDHVDHNQLFDPYCKLFEIRNINKFPGAMPVAVTKANKTLLHYGFLCALKADGERVFAIISEDNLILHFRDDHVKKFKLSVSFPTSSLFDCEYMDKENTLLIFDTLICNDRPTIRYSLQQRVEIANYFLSNLTPHEEQGLQSKTLVDSVDPIPTAYKWERVWKIPNGPHLRCKPLYNFHDAARLWHDRKHLPFLCDGIIFTRLLCAYAPFTHNPESVFKWKPDVTVDFLLSPIRDRKLDSQQKFLIDPDVMNCVSKDMTCFLHPNNERDANYYLYTVDEKGEQLRISRCYVHEKRPDEVAYKDCIGEFRWDYRSEWVLERVRNDKKTPNLLKTVLSSFDSILSAISIEELIEH